LNCNVSGVIPCYNGGTFLVETLRSDFTQAIAPFEVLVVDNDSTGQSAAIAASFGQPVRVIRQTNQGESVARNGGIAEARGEWIALIDADDLWDADKNRRCLEASKGCTAVCAGFLETRDLRSVGSSR
jgi:glycosyltransferase involved in cell wall biosynthesis